MWEYISGMAGSYILRVPEKEFELRIYPDSTGNGVSWVSRDLLKTERLMMTEKKHRFDMPLKISRWDIIDELAMASGGLSEAQKEKIAAGIRKLVASVMEESDKDKSLPSGKAVKRVNGESAVEKSYIAIESKIASMKRPDGSLISITEAADNSYFILNVNSKTKSFTLDEMRKMVKISHSSDDLNKISKELYRWFENNRKDVIFDLEITHANKRLPEIILFLKSKYAVKS